MSDATELAWAAGFFDGEGTTGVLKRARRSYLSLRVVQVDPRPLRRFCEALGLGNFYGPYVRTNEKHSDYYAWCVGSSRAHAALDLLWPYLSEPKREQASRALRQLEELNADFRDMRLKGNRARTA